MAQGKTNTVQFDYNEWCREQAEKLSAGINRLAMSGLFDAAVYIQPSKGKTQGELILAMPHEQPEGLDCLTFLAIGSRVSSIPRSALYNRLWHACRRCPICPVEA